MKLHLLVALVLLEASIPSASGLSFRRHTPSSHGHSTITLKKRLHVNTLITEPGTVEIDWSTLYSFSTSGILMPSAFRYTPQGAHILWGRTEYSINFDASAHTGQPVTLGATSVVYDGEKLDIAIAPQAVFFLSSESGARLGATAVARYDTGRNSLGATLSWSGATHASATNPAGTFDAGFGYGTRLAASGFLSRLTPHLNLVVEKSTGQNTLGSSLEGIELQLTDRLAFDLSGQHFAARGSAPEHQMIFGLTLSLGHSH